MWYTHTYCQGYPHDTQLQLYARAYIVASECLSICSITFVKDLEHYKITHITQLSDN